MSDIIGLTEFSMIEDMRRLDNVSNNLANVSTTGFKKNIPVSKSFESVLTEAQSTNQVQPKETTVVDLQQGTLRHTGNKLDIAIEGEGFLKVLKDGQVYLTRQGALSLNSRGMLSTVGGFPLDGIGGEIRLTTSAPRIDKQGRIWDGKDMVGQLQLVKVAKDAQLNHVGGGLYTPGNINTQELDSGLVNVRQGYLEASNVNSTAEMVQMIELMRHFETSQRVMKSYDNLLDTAIRTIGEL